MDIRVTAKDAVRITIDNWEIYIDNSTGEKIITSYDLEEKDNG